MAKSENSAVMRPHSVFLHIFKFFFHFIFNNQKRNTMSTADKIKQLALDKIDFADEAIETAIEELVTASNDVHTAAIQFDADAAAANITPEQAEKTSGAIVELASDFGDFYDELSDERKERVKAAFGELYRGETDDLDAAGQTLFNNTLSFIQKADEVNTLFAENI